ncbi:hypothetical protein ACIP28_29800 [Streptomyces albidoflavus]|uniref:hypothetical protein n=1 Tax=Streptomyces sp. S5 TaxID=1456735 RepID=UPI000CBEF60D|nr:hypothetical protein [Streptomyces sp. S5]MBO1286099.1 hypothetical protein [Streptomyces sampsonii]PJT45589.1 hypothetical protein CWI85_38030 [Streptomyces albidoflavus]
MRILVTLAATAAAVATFVTPAHADGSLGKEGDTLPLPLADAITTLPVAAESRAGYQRSTFKHWVDADKDGCNTRSAVMKSDGL